MKVWLAELQQDYGVRHFIGIFSTEELAKKGAAAYLANKDWLSSEELVCTEHEVQTA